MADVAEVANVSSQTVWRVINGSGAVSQVTRDRVLAAIEVTGYRLNLAARRLSTRKSSAIGILAASTADYGPTRSLFAVEQAVREAGYFPLVTSAQPGRVRESLDFLLSQAIEALAVIAPYRRTLQEVAAVGATIPITVLQAGIGGNVSSVAVDQRAGTRLAVEHLVELGHRRIQHLAGPPDFIDSGLRHAAFATEIDRAGLVLGGEIHGDWSADSGHAAAGAVDRGTTAVFCGNDQMAIGLIHGFADRGLRVPDDISVLGFDDIPEARHSLPPLTTVNQDFAAVGRRAAHALIESLALGQQPGTIAVPPRLIVRASTAEPGR
ncbi:LacI family DNA-binding transcriptional regulator [Gryllotalpicola reticulitermitis]|uniref:LacI family DNA-binding transcriptional regulator n=1 Tax=Gryllotalpicola reticulitermitis TaxID=1184153 RepID=A0ABV8Q4H2_9MICO